MPELPEVEHVCRTLRPAVLGRQVAAVELRRTDIVTGSAGDMDLLAGDTIEAVRRHGKQLALVGESGRSVVVHLGMTGRLLRLAAGVSPRSAEPEGLRPPLNAHVHVVWRFEDSTHLIFADPRRFGGLWTFATWTDVLARRWSDLGPDALRIGPATLHHRLARTRRPLKAALLDQQLVAGLGNIYVDELLFACRLSPTTPACDVDRQAAARLIRAMRRILKHAIERGGSTLRDFVDADGQPGGYQQAHRVYGRSGQGCPRSACHAVLQTTVIAGRTTTFCPSCQP